MLNLTHMRFRSAVPKMCPVQTGCAMTVPWRAWGWPWRAPSWSGPRVVEDMMAMFFYNLDAFGRGEPLEGRVDPSAGY